MDGHTQRLGGMAGEVGDADGLIDRPRAALAHARPRRERACPRIAVKTRSPPGRDSAPPASTAP